MLYIEVTFSVFCDHFQRMDRATQFTYEGKRTLWRYLNDAITEDTELDVISLCCDWTEYDKDELIKDYDSDGTRFDTFEELKEWLNDRATLLETEGDTFLVAIL